MGSQGSSSSSSPLTGAQRLESYNAGQSAISKDPMTYGGDGYTAPTYKAAKYNDTPGYNGADYVPTADVKQLGNGDYNALEQSILTSRTAPLDRAWSLRKGDINQEMADRGLWSSGAPLQQQSKEYESSFLPQYTQAGADAATQRYNLQASDLASFNNLNQSNVNSRNALLQGDAAAQNSFNLSDTQNRNALAQGDATAQNAFNSAQALQNYESSWRPADYKAGLWNGTGGTVSSGNAGGWSI